MFDNEYFVVEFSTLCDNYKGPVKIKRDACEYFFLNSRGELMCGCHGEWLRRIYWWDKWLKNHEYIFHPNRENIMVEFLPDVTENILQGEIRRLNLEKRILEHKIENIERYLK